MIWALLIATLLTPVFSHVYSSAAEGSTMLETYALTMPVIDDPVITLPVVVHVIHTGTSVGSADNPPDSQKHRIG